EVVLYNRDLLRERFRDIIVKILDKDQNEVFTSEVLNANNVMNGPAYLRLILDDLIVRGVDHMRAGGQSGTRRVNAAGDQVSEGTKVTTDGFEHDVFPLRERRARVYPISSAESPSELRVFSRRWIMSS
ncbi:MAG: hypothetical protein MI741_06540, partial [Rhodospirillales bacterium]|nr:hypothetical protein [Rhodospirillales bacterium]